MGEAGDIIQQVFSLEEIKPDAEWGRMLSDLHNFFFQYALDWLENVDKKKKTPVYWLQNGDLFNILYMQWTTEHNYSGLIVVVLIQIISYSTHMSYNWNIKCLLLFLSNDVSASKEAKNKK